MSVEPKESLRDWIALSMVAGVGRRTAAVMIERFGAPGACFDAAKLNSRDMGSNVIALKR